VHFGGVLIAKLAHEAVFSCWPSVVAALSLSGRALEGIRKDLNCSLLEETGTAPSAQRNWSVRGSQKKRESCVAQGIIGVGGIAQC
jgi:hypothetical protein